MLIRLHVLNEKTDTFLWLSVHSTLHFYLRKIISIPWLHIMSIINSKLFLAWLTRHFWTWIKWCHHDSKTSFHFICVSFYWFLYFFFFFFLFFQYNFIEHTRVQLTFTKDNLQQNENYNLKLTKKKSNTIKTLVVLKWERNQLSKQNFTPYLRETKKQTIFSPNFRTVIFASLP